MLRTSEIHDWGWVNKRDNILSQQITSNKSVIDTKEEISLNIEDILDWIGEKIEGAIYLFKAKIGAFVDSVTAPKVEKSHWTLWYLENPEKMSIIRNRLRNKIEWLINTKGPMPYRADWITLSLDKKWDLKLSYSDLGVELKFNNIRDESENSLPNVNIKNIKTDFTNEQRIDYFTQAIISRFYLQK